MARHWLLAQVWPIEPVTAADEKRREKLFWGRKFFLYGRNELRARGALAHDGAFAFDAHFRQRGLKLLS